MAKAAPAARPENPLKYRKYFWGGWYVTWEWRYRCHLCGRKGFTPYGFFLHLVNRHGLSEGHACYLRDVRAEPCAELDERRVKVGGLAFIVRAQDNAENPADGRVTGGYNGGEGS